MSASDANVEIAALSEERLKLEREALAVERERLAAARLAAETQAKLSERKRHPFLAFVSIVLLAALAFAGGTIFGISVAEERQQSRRAARLREALSQLDNLDAPAQSGTTSQTNRPTAVHAPVGAHRNVSVMVIQ